MKKIFPLLLLFLSISLFSQDSSSLSFGVAFNPKVVTNVFEKSNEIEVIYPLSGSIAGNVYLNLNTRLSLQTGLSFGFLKTGKKDYSVLFGCDNDGNGNFLPRNSWRNAEYTHYYIGIPITVQWHFSDKTNRTYLKLGQEILFKIGKKTTDEIIECGTNTLSLPNPSNQFSHFIIAFDFGIGYEFRLNEKIHCFFEPNLEFSLNPFLKNDLLLPPGSNEVNRHFLNIGINTGFRF